MLVSRLTGEGRGGGEGRLCVKGREEEMVGGGRRGGGRGVCVCWNSVARRVPSLLGTEDAEHDYDEYECIM
jgi:hypothetical protein